MKTKMYSRLELFRLQLYGDGLGVDHDEGRNAFNLKDNSDRKKLATTPGNAWNFLREAEP